ncbi:MAG: hypothetical protein U0414_38395 [Polyangiaceae bacterium]
MRRLEVAAVLLSSAIAGCGGAPPLTEDTTINVKVESPVPVGFYTHAYQPYVATPSSASTPSAPPTATKLCDAPCTTPATIGPYRLFWVGEESGGARVVLPAEKDVIVTYRPGTPTAATVGAVIVGAGALSLLTSALLFLAPIEGNDPLQSPAFVVGLAFGGTGVVAGAVGIPIVAAFEPKADARPAASPK